MEDFPASVLLDPVNVIGLFDAEKIIDAEAGFAEAAGGVLQLAFAGFVFFAPGLDLDELGQPNQSICKVRRISQAGFAHAEFAVALEGAPIRDLIKKRIRARHQLRDHAAGRAVFHGLEEAFFRSRVIEPLQAAADSELGNFHTDVLGGNVFDGVGLVKDHEVFGKKQPALALFLILDSTQQGEEQGVIEHDDVGGQHPAAHGLVETARILRAGFLGADVVLAAHFLPDGGFRLFQKIAERSVARGQAPFADAFEFLALFGGEEIAGLAQGAFQPGAAEKIVAALQKRGLEFNRQQLLHQGDVLVHELFL